MNDTEQYTPTSYSFPKFHGQGESFFKIWIVNTLLSIVTFGLYSPWAKVRSLKYIYGSTELEGSRFDFTGDPMAILKGRIIAGILFSLYVFGGSLNYFVNALGVVLFYALLPWIFTKSLQFKLANTLYRNIHFAFKGSIKEAYQIWIRYASFPFIMAILSLVLSIFLVPEQTQNATKNLSVLFVLVPTALTFLYYLFFISRGLRDVFSFIYNNIYYGGVKTKIQISREDIAEHVVKNFLITAVSGYGIIIGLILLTAFIFPALMGFIFIAVYIFTFGLTIYLNYLIINFIWNRATLGENNPFVNKIEPERFIIISLQNIFLISITLGLYYPWAAMRIKKYKTENRGIAVEDKDSFIQTVQDNPSALGSEFESVFDLGFEIGL